MFDIMGDEMLDMDLIPSGMESINIDIETIKNFFKKNFGFDVQIGSTDLHGFIHMVIGKKYKCAGAYLKTVDGTPVFRLWVQYKDEPYYSEGFNFAFHSTPTEFWMNDEPDNFFIERNALDTQFVGLKDSSLHDGCLHGNLHKGEILHRFVKIRPLSLSVSYRQAVFLHYESKIPEIRKWIRGLVD